MKIDEQGKTGIKNFRFFSFILGNQSAGNINNLMSFWIDFFILHVILLIAAVIFLGGGWYYTGANGRCFMLHRSMQTGIKSEHLPADIK